MPVSSIRMTRAGGRPWCLATAALLAASACGGGDLGTDSRPRIPSTGAESLSPRWSPSDAWYVDTVPTVVVGLRSGDPDHELQDIRAGRLQPDGGMVLVDAGARRIRRFDAEGGLVAAWGREGDGPGEFRNPVQVLGRGDGGWVVWDDAHWRATSYAADGSLGEVETMAKGSGIFTDPGAEIWSPVRLRLLAEARYLLELTEMDRSGKDSPGKASGRSDGGADAAGETRDGPPTFVAVVSETGLSRAPVPPLRGRESTTVAAPWGTLDVTPPLARGPVLATQPDGSRFCAGDQRDPRVTCVDATGQATVIQWQAGPLPVSPVDPVIRRWRDEVSEDLGAKLAEMEIRDLVDQVALPEWWPAYRGLDLDRDGNLWVERGPTEEGVGRQYLVFDTSGAHLGSVDLPEGRILEIGPRSILMVRWDELDVQRVELLPLVKTGHPRHAGANRAP